MIQDGSKSVVDFLGLVWSLSFYRGQPHYISHFSVRLSSVFRPSVNFFLAFDWLKICYIVEEVIEVDELDKSNISAAAENQDK